MEIIHMKTLFMGTGAADWDITLRREGEFYRRFTSFLINDDLLIDFNLETIDFINQNKISLKNVKNILITHTHGDHYSADGVNRVFDKNVTLWCDSGARERIGNVTPRVKTINTFEKSKAGNYSVIAVPANHSVSGSAEKPLHYIISDGDKTLLWGCDGAWFLNDSWREIKNHKYDLAVYDGTLSDKPGDYRIFEHNNLNMIKEMHQTFVSGGLLKDGGKAYISHMSKESQYSHEKLAEYLKEYGIAPAYDGLLAEI